MKIMKSLAKLVCPSSASIASSSAHSIATGYNGLHEERRLNLAKYSASAKKIMEYQAKIDTIIQDGIIDPEEEARIAAALEPLIEEAKKLVFD